MDRGPRLALACLTLFLVLVPLAAGKPGLPPTLKADEPAYYLMALSLARDGDLRCEAKDLARLQEEYPFLPTDNLILMSRDGWHTTYFGKPYVYSLAAAPAAALFGANGLVAFNMLLLMLMVWLGAKHLARFNTSAVATLFSAGFFLVSTAFAYVFWLQPEVFNMTAVALCLYLALHPGSPATPPANRLLALLRYPFGAATLPAWSGAALALAAYNKPVLAAIGLPALWILLRRRGRRQAGLWLAGAALAGVLLAAVSVGLTGQPSAYLGAARGGVAVADPLRPPIEPAPPAPAGRPSTANSWSWIFHLPAIDGPKLAGDLGYFLWGRHTGLLLYMPFSLLALVLFGLHSRRSSEGWVILAALAMVAGFFLVWIPFNWHGGGGFIGNRYFVNVYPAFLFLVTRARPVGLVPLGYAAGGLMLGTILFTPFGAPVPEPTLQAHVRNPPFGLFPLELPFLRALPGYQGTSQLGLRFVARRDVFQRHGEEMWIEGGRTVELWVTSAVPLERAVFGVRSEALPNHVSLDLEGHRQELELSDEGGRFQIAELAVGAPRRRMRDGDLEVGVYRLLVTTERGAVPAEQVERLTGRFYLGAALTYFGPTDPRTRQPYRLTWGTCDVPTRMVAGSTVTITTRLTNESTESWPASGPVQVQLSYHWLAESGETVVRDGLRTALGDPVEPGNEVVLEQRVEAPPTPGRYLLELDPVLEYVSWFSQRNAGNTFRATVEVVAP